MTAADWQPESPDISTLDVDCELYIIRGFIKPDPTKEAKKKYAEDHSVSYTDLKSKKIAEYTGENGGAVVLVVHDLFDAVYGGED